MNTAKAEETPGQRRRVEPGAVCTKPNGLDTQRFRREARGPLGAPIRTVRTPDDAGVALRAPAHILPDANVALNPACAGV